MALTNITGNQLPVGAIVSSMFTLAQFQAQNGLGWVLANGANVSGSSYAAITLSSTIPDLRGMALRGKNNGRVDGNQNPDGDSALGTYQADQFGTHQHVTNSDGVTDTNIAGYSYVANNGPNDLSGNSGISHGFTANSGGNESRMKNITVNHFIRIN
jgi:hypothetical protein